MALNTNLNYRNQLMYCVFVRNYSEEGTFEAVRRDLQRIQALGTDIVWLMPIHPLGQQARKGSLGSPYAVKDYRAINPEFGTMDDFQALVEDIHSLGMKCIIDVVYNHTAPDSWLAQHHPEWFYHKPDGGFGNRVGDWTDIVDLDYSHPALWDYQIETLKTWAQYVDGFRCDVAPLVPVEFWLKAREEVEAVRPGCFWLAESVEPGFITHLRSCGLVAHSDSELYQAFDLCYDYDIMDAYVKAFETQAGLEAYAEAVNRQEYTYPANFVKLRGLENHDRARAASLAKDEKVLRNWTAFSYFQKGMAFLYNGQEVQADHQPTLFDKDTIRWDWSRDMSPFLRRLREIKRDDLFTNSTYKVQVLPGEFLMATHRSGEGMLLGIFAVRGNNGLVEVPLPDGNYENLITGEKLLVWHGRLSVQGEPIVIKM